jgi:hypothetical protein
MTCGPDTFFTADSSGLLGLLDTPERSQQERTGPEDRHAKFSEISDNLARAQSTEGHTRGPPTASVVGSRSQRRRHDGPDLTPARDRGRRRIPQPPPLEDGGFRRSSDGAARVCGARRSAEQGGGSADVPDEDQRVRSLATIANVVLGVLVASQHDYHVHLSTSPRCHRQSSRRR